MATYVEMPNWRAFRMSFLYHSRNLFPGKKPDNWEVYDIVKDPAEKNNIAAENRDLINRAIAILDREYQPAPGFQALRYKAPEQVAE